MRKNYLTTATALALFSIVNLGQGSVTPAFGADPDDKVSKLRGVLRYHEENINVDNWHDSNVLRGHGNCYYGNGLCDKCNKAQEQIDKLSSKNKDEAEIRRLQLKMLRKQAGEG